MKIGKEHNMSIELPELLYPYDALEPLISSTTLKTHHGKHHRGYVDKVSALVRNTPVADSSLEKIVQWPIRHAATDKAAVAVFNNAAQAWNHSFYWNSLRPRDQTDSGPRGKLAALIASRFGGYGGFTEAFKAAATSHFGSGWAWLVINRGALEIVTTSNADTPLAQDLVPLLVIDVWEHAYYLDYQERRAAYVAGIVDYLLNWDFAERNFDRLNNRFGAASPTLTVA
ncbi:Superoxide dismutase [Fe] [Georgfuchsia toluolica]|uniref:Superoxide dismutase n=1 Tax=Georgfuchsia toluolica TaxID=424218 RepID=A0A916J548_9PROT|nr:superoxide dismutase [Georgfuchsia toluolica]CAG4884737.1 Superoxide dismutase [Fe] [Georgfuchsia toluolica]